MRQLQVERGQDGRLLPELEVGLPRIGGAGAIGEVEGHDAALAGEALASPTGTPAWSPSFNPDGSLFAAAWPGRDLVPEDGSGRIEKGLVKILDLRSGRTVQVPQRPSSRWTMGTPPRLAPPEPPVSDTFVWPWAPTASTSFNTSGALLTVTSRAGEPAVVVDVRSGDEVLTLEEARFFVRAEWSPNGTSIATITEDGGVDIFDARTGRRRSALPGGLPGVEDLAFSADGSRLAGSSTNGIVRIWTTDSGEQELVLRSTIGPDERSADPEQPPTRPGSIAFSPDGTELAHASADGHIWVWPLDLDDLIQLAKRGNRTLNAQECQQYLHVDHCPQE
jgi:WD40 repeat protein